MRSVCLFVIGLVLPLSSWAQAATGANTPGGKFNLRLENARLFGDLILENEPLSWIAPGGELTPFAHRAPVGSTLHPRYFFSAELRQHFVVFQPQIRRFQFSIDPTFNVRMRTDLDSKPVKTPSYHIGVWGSYSLWQNNQEEYEDLPLTGKSNLRQLQADTTVHMPQVRENIS